MSNGLLAWWHRRITSSGLAGAALCAVPVAVAAVIGLGTSLSGIASGFAALTSGPDRSSISAQTDPSAETDRSRLNRLVVALSSQSGSSLGSNPGGDTITIGARQGATGSGTGTGAVVGTDGSGSSVGGSGSPTISAPDVSLPGTGGASDTVNNTVNSVGGTVDSTVDSVNNTLNGVNSTVNGLLGQ
jgi:hypothetical protein